MGAKTIVTHGEKISVEKELFYNSKSYQEVNDLSTA